VPDQLQKLVGRDELTFGQNRQQQSSDLVTTRLSEELQQGFMIRRLIQGAQGYSGDWWQAALCCASPRKPTEKRRDAIWPSQDDEGQVRR
jgi:hypothetical protein